MIVRIILNGEVKHLWEKEDAEAIKTYDAVVKTYQDGLMSNHKVTVDLLTKDMEVILTETMER